jgi:hypothetical protein
VLGGSGSRNFDLRTVLRLDVRRRRADRFASSQYNRDIWRRVEIASDAKLPDVSRALLAAMGWDDSHLHGFSAHGESYGVPDPDFPSTYRDERRVTLAQLAPRPKDHFIFDYDFGDGWEHRVVVEATADADPEASYLSALSCGPARLSAGGLRWAVGIRTVAAAIE